jgi:hypothetical protein
MRKIVHALPFALFALASQSASSAGNDELWEMTTTMKMQGMAMPGGKSKSCIAKDGAYNPDTDKKDKNCTTTDYKVSGNTVRWAMKCTGKDAMTGTGEMTRTADTMKGVMKMNAQGMDMEQVMEGKRIGTCDAAAQKKAVDDAVADITAANASGAKLACDNAVRMAAESGGRGNADNQFKGKGPCVAQKAQLCEQIRSRAGTHAGFAKYIQNRDQAKTLNQSWGWALGECGIDIETSRPGLCQRAVADRNYRFIGGFCPNEAAQLNAKECAGFGRDYTADMARPNAGMCRALRARAADYQDADTKANAEADKARAAENAKKQEEATGKAAASVEKMKKMFGF